MQKKQAQPGFKHSVPNEFREGETRQNEKGTFKEEKLKKQDNFFLLMI